MKKTLQSFLKNKRLFIPTVSVFVTVILILVVCIIALNEHATILGLFQEKQQITRSLNTTKQAFTALKNQDQYKINLRLKEQVKKTHDDYTKSIGLYEQILDLQAQKQDTKKLDDLYALIVKQLSDLKYASSESSMKDLQDQITQANTTLSLSQTSSANTSAPLSNTPPASGFSLQQVNTDTGTFPVAIISADLTSTKVIVDTASDSDCSSNCPALSLADYVSRNGAFAGINGSFFCPPEYPSCAGKTNSFDTLLMNKNKKYFNSDNNVFSSVPLVYFTGNTMGMRTASSQWGRDTSVDAVIAMQPGLLFNGNIIYSGGGADKFTAKGLRGFIGNKGSTVYIGFVYNATMTDSARVLKSLGLENAINLDEGGSAALWDGGYKIGPGRNMPNAVLFLRK